jgi:glycerol uptake facilitator protein
VYKKRLLRRFPGGKILVCLPGLLCHSPRTNFIMSTWNAYGAEFAGTALLILLGDGVVANVVLNKTKGNQGGWIVIALGWAMGVFAGVLCAKDASGAHLNPAVSIALAVAGKFSWTLVPGYVAAQMLGAFAGAMLVYAHYRQHFAVSDNPDAKLGVFCTGPAIRGLGNNFFCETLGCFVLLFAVLYITEPQFASQGDNVMIGLGTIGALPVALMVLAIGLSLGGTTGYAINPARDLSPRLAHALLPIPGKRDSDWGYSWVPVLGPIVGGLIAVGVWRGLSAL